MANNFTVTNVTKSARRDLSTPIATVDQIVELGSMIINDNPFGCISHIDSDGNTVDPVVINREYYVKKYNYFAPYDGPLEGKKVGSLSVRYPTAAGYKSSNLTDDAALLTAFNAEEGYIEPSKDIWSLQLKCHDVSGDDYYVTFTRDAVRVSSFQDDAILEKVETWADGVGMLD